MYNPGYGVYQDAQAQELDQAKLVLMMYRGAINFLTKALDAGKTDKIQMGHYVSKAKNVILELMLSLNLEESGKMGEMLLEMYQKLFKKLNVAHMRDDTQKIAAVKDSFEELEETWIMVFESDLYQEFKQDRELFHIRYSMR